jgi:CheY-like chemotaxis protein
MSRPSVLVVEDNPLNQKLVQRFLEAKGFSPMLATTTDEAEDCLSKQRPDMILMDVSLPGEGGLSLVRRLRSAGDKGMPIIAVTAHAMPGDREVAIEAGCDGYLTKPIELRQLLSVMLSHLPQEPQEASS